MVDARRETADFRFGLLAGLIVLVIQFVLGMAVNLFVTVPTHHPGANPPEYFSGVAQSVTWAILHGPLLLILHASLGLLLVLSAFGLLFRAIRTRHSRMIWITALGGLAILFAGFNGGSFLNYHQDFSSMLMAGFFAVAVLAYSAGLYLVDGSA
ncbi:MAG TPA: hypothetical protein VET26_07460 [Candidatus Sulfotelmatobacter sp.]|nr:hypothetical protein [Candidatus Sulfotelmatobacter sp.]